MKKLNIFLDTCIINRILDLDKPESDTKYEEDRNYLIKILDLFSKNKIKFFINPSVKTEISKTMDRLRRHKLLDICSRYEFISFNKNFFPLYFPFTFVSEEKIKLLNALCEDNPALNKDIKIIADPVFCTSMDIVLTTDRRHLAGKGIHLQNLKIFTPKELFLYLRRHLD